MFSPILNSFINNRSTKELAVWVIAFYIFQTLFGWYGKEPEFTQGLTFVSFIGLYMLGAYLKRTELKIFKMGTIQNLMVYFGVGVLCVIMEILTMYYGFNKSIFSYISPFQIIQTIYLFLFCKNLNVKEGVGKRLIMFFSFSAFAALLAHTWEGTTIYNNGLHYIDNYYRLSFFPTILFIISYFCLACIIDKLRIFLWEKIRIKAIPNRTYFIP